MECSILCIICFGSVVLLIIMVFWLLVFVINGIGVVLCCVNVWLMCCVVVVELVNVIFVMVGWEVSVLLILVLCFGKSWMVLVGKFVFCISLIVWYVIKLVCLVGLVIMVFLVIKVVLIWLRKIVSGKFYGLIYINILWFWWLIWCVDLLKFLILNLFSILICLL